MPAPSDGSNDGTHTYDYRAIDNAGNPSAAYQCKVKSTPRGRSSRRPTSPPTTSGWTSTSPQTVGLAATDAGAGVKLMQYAVDGVGPTTYSSPFTVLGTGSHAVVYTATDQLGNTTQNAESGEISSTIVSQSGRT